MHYDPLMVYRPLFKMVCVPRKITVRDESETEELFMMGDPVIGGIRNVPIIKHQPATRNPEEPGEG